MKKHRLLDTRAGYILASLGMLFGVLAPAAIPVLATAGTVNSRSITLSSSAPSATGVNYELKGTAQTAIPTGGGLVLQFCDNASGPLVGLSCAVPSGMAITSVTLDNTVSTPNDGSITVDNTAKTITWTAGATGISAAGSFDLVFKNVTNPSTAGTFYARITTYVGAPNYTNATTPGTVADQGGFALSLNNSFDVTAYVEEALTFCVANIAPSKGCTGLTPGTTDPGMTIGETLGTQKVLDSTKLSTGTDYAQVSSNAAHGVIVNLQSSTTGCGGLIRLNDTTNCDIGPQNVVGGTIAAGNALFGIELGASTDGSGDATGTGTLLPSGNYTTSKYFLDYVIGDASGVTSTYGSALFNSNGAPVGNMNIPFTFGVSAAPSTPAGIYSATLNLVATGTF